jgi:putative transposase
VLKDEVGEYTERLLDRLSEQKELEVLELNVQEDHVHRVLIIPPKYSVSEVRGYLKGKIAIRLFERYKDLGKRYWGRHLWSRGYCVSTVGIDEEQIRKYVKWQEAKEKQLEKGSLFS